MHLLSEVHTQFPWLSSSPESQGMVSPTSNTRTDDVAILGPRVVVGSLDHNHRSSQKNEFFSQRPRHKAGVLHEIVEPAVGLGTKSNDAYWSFGRYQLDRKRVQISISRRSLPTRTWSVILGVKWE